MENMRNILRIKDIPSNTIEEAIIILKANKKINKYEYTEKFKKMYKTEKKDNSYVIKEAEFIINDYLTKSEKSKKSVEIKNRKLKIINMVLLLFLIVSIIF